MRPKTAAMALLALVYGTMTTQGPFNGCHAHTTGPHGRTGSVDPTNTEPMLPEITGPFEMEVVMRLDDVAQIDDRYVVQYSTVDGDNSIHDVISLEVVTGTGTSTKTDLQLRVRPRNGVWCTSVRAVNVIVPTEVATFIAAVQADGTAWIAKNGVRVATVQSSTCPVPANVVRNSKLVGRNQFNAAHRFRGAIVGVRVKNYSSSSVGGGSNNGDLAVEQEYLSLPGQIYGQAFTVTFWARFDLFTGRNLQTVFDFAGTNASGQTSDRIWFGQRGNDDDRVELIICRGVGICRDVDQAYASPAVLLGKWNYWHVGITKDGNMFVQRNGLAVETDLDEPLPNNVFRSKLLIGQSTRATDSPFWGAILGLRVDVLDGS